MYVFPILKLGNVHVTILFPLKYDIVTNACKTINHYETTMGHENVIAPFPLHPTISVRMMLT